jgi:protein-tyrosine sulfotransferase
VNKKSKLVSHIRYTHFPLLVRRGFNCLNGVYRSITNWYPLSAKPGHVSSEPVFIISAGRSGTTLLRSMLVASGQIAIPAETQIIHRLAVLFLTTRSLGWEDQARLVISAFESHKFFPLWQINLAEVYPKVLALPKNERSLARIIHEVYMSYAVQAFPGAKNWGDQSPLHTFYLPYINRIFPQARYIHMLRDGRDVTASLVSRFGDDHLFESVLRWKTSLKRVKQLQRIIEPGQFLEIRYESLVREPEETLHKICQFIDIDYTALMLDYWKLPSTIEHKYDSYHMNLEKPVFDSSIGNWKDVLNPRQQQYVMRKLSRELQELGYIQ